MKLSPKFSHSSRWNFNFRKLCFPVCCWRIDKSLSIVKPTFHCTKTCTRCLSRLQCRLDSGSLDRATSTCDTAMFVIMRNQSKVNLSATNRNFSAFNSMKVNAIHHVRPWTIETFLLLIVVLSKRKKKLCNVMSNRDLNFFKHSKWSWAKSFWRHVPCEKLW